MFSGKSQDEVGESFRLFPFWKNWETDDIDDNQEQVDPDNSRQRRRISTTTTSKRKFIRGVNVGGWLVLERFITPYMFALTDCHIRGDFCWFPGQLSAPSSKAEVCDMYHCQFLLDDDKDFVAVDEYTLTSQFEHKALAKQYLEYHWDSFVTKQDVATLQDAGITHVRVPMPHWIMGDILENEPYVDGQWLYFVRFVGWCREYGLEVWPDIHTAPGSQNGFDNSGQLLEDAPTCQHWSTNPAHVKRSLQAVKDIATAVVRDNLGDVVTGFGVLNEPFADCDVTVVQEFYNDALRAVRTILGEDTAVYIGDLFNATVWNNKWWTDEDEFSNTYLDSHYYHVFDGNDRKLSPKQHIALVCGKDTRATQACCYQDAPKNTLPSRGISRMIGEWSAAYDTEPKYMLDNIMAEIRNKKGDTANFDLPKNNRTMAQGRQWFLRHFVEAQMVAYESAPVPDDGNVQRAWFFWTLKMEFGAFGEWDFLRGYQEGWFPTLPSPSESAEAIYGTCRDIAEKTADDNSIIQEFPDPKTHSELWYGPPVDDDFVLSHAESLDETGTVKKTTTTTTTTTTTPTKDTSKAAETNDATSAKKTTPSPPTKKPTTSTTTGSTSTKSSSTATKDEEKSDQVHPMPERKKSSAGWFPLFCIVFFAWGIWKVFLKDGNIVRNRHQYTSLDTPTQLSV